jgi:hypothetical protein
MSFSEPMPPEPRHKGKRIRTWAAWGGWPDRQAHRTRNGRGAVGQLRRGK